MGCFQSIRIFGKWFSLLTALGSEGKFRRLMSPGKASLSAAAKAT
jgi:hypothetical protein